MSLKTIKEYIHEYKEKLGRWYLKEWETGADIPPGSIGSSIHTAHAFLHTIISYLQSAISFFLHLIGNIKPIIIKIITFFSYFFG